LNASFVDGASYINQKNMRLNAWATEVEIYATAQLLGKDIIVYTQRGEWLRHVASGTSSVHTSHAIYLDGRKGNHFDPVTHV
jgi:hypothetical protein